MASTDLVDLTGATILAVKPGDVLVFVMAHELAPWDGEQVLEELARIFPQQRVHIVSSCQGVLQYEPLDLSGQ